MCNHPYKIYFQSLKSGYCFDCNSTLSDALFIKSEQKEYKNVIMPPMFEAFTEERWRQLSPWPYLDYEAAKSFYVYFGCLYSQEYIILPVLDEKEKPIFYQARSLDKNVKKSGKYISAPGVKKMYWISYPIIHCVPWFICEGIADAIYMSQFGNSVGLMGLDYDGSLDHLLDDSKVYMCLDSDIPGYLAGLYISTLLKNSKVTFINLPAGKDPVDIPIKEMSNIIESRGRL